MARRGAIEAVGPGNERRSEGQWPRVTAIVPARDEAHVIGQAVASLTGQDYPGRFAVMVVDDQSSDGTASAARRAAGAGGRVTVLEGQSPPPGWAGKVWAMVQGVAAAEVQPEPPDYLLFVDADIVLEERLLRRLIAFAEARRAVLASLMVKLRCESSGGTLAGSRLHFLFPDALPVFLGRRPAPEDGRRRRRLHAGPPAIAGGGGRARGDAWSADRRLRPCRSDEAARPNPPLAHAARVQPALLSGLRGLRPDGRAFGFRRAALLRAASDDRRGRDGVRVRGASR